MRYDVKIYEKGKEKETIRSLSYGQMVSIRMMLKRLKVKFFVRHL